MYPPNCGMLHEKKSVTEAIPSCENPLLKPFFPFFFVIFSLTYGAVISEETHCVVHGNSLSDTDPLHWEGLERKRDRQTLADWPLEYEV